MGVRDLASIFSRYFIVGFFLPVFFTLIFLAATLSRKWVPESLETMTGADILVVAGVSVLGALVLSGMKDPLRLLFQGHRSSPAFRLPDRTVQWLVARQLSTFDELTRARDAPESSPRERSVAAYALDQRFPHDRDDVLPSRLGNAVSATQDYVFDRWGLDTQAVWPHLEALLSPQERELVKDADTDLNFFNNGALGALVVLLVLAIDELVNAPISRAWMVAYPIGLLTPYALYRLGVGAAVRWGAQVRAAADLHRLALYRAMGLRPPAPREERERLAPALNLFLLYGEPFPARYHEDDDGARGVG